MLFFKKGELFRKKPLAINLIIFLNLFQIIFSVFLVFLMTAMFFYIPDASSSAYEFKNAFSMSLFKVPVEALTFVHFSIMFFGIFIPAILMMLTLMYISKKKLKNLKSIIFIKIILDVLRMSTLGLIVDGISLYVVYKDKNTIKYFSEKLSI